MDNAIYSIPEPTNEPVLGYATGSAERASLKERLQHMYETEIEVPARIGGDGVRTGNTVDVVCPHEHGHRVAVGHLSGPTELRRAVDVALEARREWSRTPWHARAAVFLRAAELLAGPYRDVINASTMLGQSKSAHQAEIDAACELIDFLRFNVSFLHQLYGMQPAASGGAWNRLEYRPLEGFVLAISPFNFTSIAANLPAAPALMGNTVVWKPATNALYSAHFLMDLFEEAGLPPGVINLVPARGRDVSEMVVRHPDLAGLHFTGSTATFNHLFHAVSSDVSRYRSYPRIVGETGGKGFVFAHRSADVDALVTALVRGAFEYQGQKCSAASRAYVPESLWPSVRKRLLQAIGQIRVGDVRDFTNFMNAVIDKEAYDKIMRYIELATASSDAEVLIGGEGDPSTGYFIRPTVVQTTNPRFRTMVEEIFGPVLSVYVYPDVEYERTLKLCDEATPFALTGALFGTDRAALLRGEEALRGAAGNFYFNDKPTGAVVGQQPFGGSRASGTDDKAGSWFNLLRWTAPRTVKETFVPPTDFRYPFMEEP